MTKCDSDPEFFIFFLHTWYVDFNSKGPRQS